MYSLLARRSIRKYTEEKVPESKVLEIINAAMAAPSAGDQRPWHFVIINKREILDQIPGFHPYASMVKQASVAILICGDPTLEMHKNYWVQDCSAATQNILIAIQALGLGGVWLGVYPRETRVVEFRKLLEMPEEIIPFALIPIGYPDEYLPPAVRYDESRIKFNKW
ncbi:MAG: nitroreductase family protein [Cyanobacteriota bacterium]